LVARELGGAEGFSDAPALAALGWAGGQQSNIAIADLDLTGAVQHCSPAAR